MFMCFKGPHGVDTQGALIDNVNVNTQAKAMKEQNIKVKVVLLLLFSHIEVMHTLSGGH